MRLLISAAIITAALISRLQASPVPIVNYSFETDVVPSDGNPATVNSSNDDSVSFAPTGWSNNIGGILTRRPGSFFNNLVVPTPDPADGPNEQMVWSNGGSYEYQVLTTNLAANTLYTLKADVGIRGDVPTFPGADI